MQEPLSEEIRQWGMWCHLSALVASLVGVLLPIPFLNLLAPYLVWQNGKNQHPFVDEQGKESLNFQISMSLYALILILLFVLLIAVVYSPLNTTTGAQRVNETMTLALSLLLLFLFLLLGLAIFSLVAVIFASVKARQGQSYRYPFTQRFLR